DPDKTNVSLSRSSRYCGNSFSVFRRMDGTSIFHPSPNGLLPKPELYARPRLGENPFRAEATGKATPTELVPLAGLTENFSSIPLSAPPPFGSEISGISILFD